MQTDLPASRQIPRREFYPLQLFHLGLPYPIDLLTDYQPKNQEELYALHTS